jgi:hypothetical protein
MIYDVKKQIDARGKKLVDDLSNYKKGDYLHDVVIQNFLADFYYMVEEVKYVYYLIKKEKLKTDNKTLSDLKKMIKEGNDHICAYYAYANDYDWENRKMFTKKEIKDRNDKMAKEMKKILAEMDFDKILKKGN